MSKKVAHHSRRRRSIVITRRVRRGCEGAYEALLKGLLEETKSFPGFEGGQVLRPNGPDRLEYQITLHFENRQAEERWAGSEERRRWDDGMKVLEGTSEITILTGLETWFTLPAEGHTKTAPRYKITFVVWTAIFPTVLVLSALLSWLPFEMPLLLSVFAITAITVPTAVYILLPRLCRLFDPWVYRESKVDRDRDTRRSLSTESEERLLVEENRSPEFPK